MRSLLKKLRDLSTLRKALIALALLAVLAPIPTVVDRFLDRQARLSILHEAEAKALKWAKEFVVQIPSIASIIASGEATPAQEQRILDSIAVGDVFRFKLFRPDGDLSYVSDERLFELEGGKRFNQSALDVYRSGESDVSVHHGRAGSGRPETYVEAYVPAVAADGERIGVIEVYVDATAVENVLRQAFSELSLLLIVGSAAVFVLPAAAVSLHSRQLRLRDRRLAELQRIDQLTGVLNRNALSLEISEIFYARAPDEALGVLFIDVDNFKLVNDRFGHKQGDQVLRKVAQTLLTHTRRTTDIVGRFGGDEFVLICRGVDHESLIDLVKRIQNELKWCSEAAGLPVTPTLSVGAHLSPPDEDEHSALHAADLAVYEAKRRGRNQMVEFFEDLDESFQRRRQLEALLRGAIAHNRLELHFQPIFSAADRRLRGFEALLRLRDPEAGLVSPGEFIPIAECAGLIDELGDWALRRALETAKDWPADLFVSVNLSVAQFKSGDLRDQINDALEASGVDPSRLELEITESLIIDDDHDVWEQLRQIKALGASIAIDDFGAGNTSIGHLWKFSFDKIKLDRSFLIAREFDEEAYYGILRAVTSLGAALDVTVVAEGVEREDQMRAVVELGVDQAQGFLLGKPSPDVSFAELGDSLQAAV